MNLHECILTNNDCYTTNRTITPKGVMVHSTGANNPNLRRYVQPDDGLLGTNGNANDWNRSGTSACVHAFVGKLKDGTIATYQTLPWSHRGWHAGTGTSGTSANNTHISFEICEDALSDKTYFSAVYQEAVDLTAYLCSQYGLDPKADGVVICHSEGYQRGVASQHADVLHWFPTFNKTMDDFRTDVAAAMTVTAMGTTTTTTTEEDEDMTQDKFNEMMDVYLQQLGELEPSDWSADAREKVEAAGLIKGDENGKKKYKSFMTRETMAVMLSRLMEKMGIS
jgi:N-acetylmuramoyl-L-alanine amidase